MSQIVDLDVWAGAVRAPEPDQPDADLEATSPIPPLAPDCRRRPLPSGRDNDAAYRGRW